MKENKTLVKMTAIICLTAIEIANLLTTNIDGAFLTFIVSIIAGLAGYEFGRKAK